MSPAFQFLDINFSFASLELLDSLINLIISSILDNATAKPSNMWAFSLAFLKSKIVLLVTISLLCSINADKISLRLTALGFPSIKATILILKDVLICVC